MNYGNITLGAELIPYITDGGKALFHCWSWDGVKIVGIVEDIEGIVSECDPCDIMFADDKFNEYVWR